MAAQEEKNQPHEHKEHQVSHFNNGFVNILVSFFFLRNWLRSLVPLVVIMGLTWVFGVLIVEVEELLPLAYIYTILVGFQGLFIFLAFVVFSEQVRDEYVKWLKKSDTLSKYFSTKSSRLSTAMVRSLCIASWNIF